MKKYLFLLLLANYYWIASAQILGEPATVQSPNATAISIFGDIPVSLYTGLPSVKIPLYSVQEGNIAVPISLEYHASGFRPEVHPGWVGIGWNLNTGGTITRSVNGLPDELNPTHPSANQYSKSGYYFHTDLLNKSNWGNIENVQSIAQVDYNPPQDPRPLFADSQPDEFSFNFGEYNGKFYLNSNGAWKVKCNKPIIVRPYDYNSGSIFQPAPFPRPDESTRVEYGETTTFAGFIIVTEDGTQYIFGGSSSAIEYEMGMFYQNSDPWVATAWHLSQIIQNDGHTVSFNYEREKDEYTAQMYISLSKLISSSLDTGSDSQSNLSSGSCSVEGGTRCKISESYGGKLVAPVYLSSIKTSNNTIYFDRAKSVELKYARDIFEFRYNELRNQGISERIFPFLRTPRFQEYPACLDKLQWRKLISIRVFSNASSQTIKKISFAYNNDDPTNLNSPNERLTLLKVNEQGGNGIGIPPYKFGYNKYHNLPAYLTDQVDHWGFYNANYINASIDIDYKNPNNNYYSHREANSDSSIYLSGMLTRIVYPTGGYTNFNYEQHDFGKQLDEYRFNPPSVCARQIAGGVRIRKIVSYNPNNQQAELEKEYLYVNGYSPTNSSTLLTSSGILGGRARYTYIGYRGRAFNRNNSLYSRSFFSTQSVLPSSSNSQGSHIGYSTVIEKRSDGSYVEYKYSNFDTDNLDEAPVSILQATVQGSRTLYSPYTSTSEERGKLLRQIQFNDKGQKIAQKDIEYIALNKSTEYVPSIKGSNSKPCAPSLGDAVDEGAAFKFYTYSYLPNKETETVFDVNGNNGITTVRDIIYNSYRLVQRESTTDSKGATVEAQYKYIFDFPYYGGQPYIPLTRGMVLMSGLKNMVGLPIQTLRLRNGKLTSATVALYSEFQPGQVLPNQLLEFTPTQPIDLNQYTQPGFRDPYGLSNYHQFVVDPKLLPKLTFTSYDDKGNLLGLTKEGNQFTSYQWGYNKTLLVAKTDNALPSEVFSSNFEEDKMAATAAADVAGTWYSPGGYLRFEVTPSDPNHPSTRKTARTGQLAGAMYTRYQGEQAHAFSTTLTLPASASRRRYIFSGWVYTNGPAASIWLFPNLPSAQNPDGTINYYDGLGYDGSNPNKPSRPDLFPSYASTEVDKKPDQIGHWVYLQKEVLIPGDATLITFRITNFWNGAGNAAAVTNGGGVWFDDVRMYPAAAQMTTFTHQIGAGSTSISDANNRPAITEFDELNRLNVVRDQDGNIVKQLDYHYQH